MGSVKKKRLRNVLKDHSSESNSLKEELQSKEIKQALKPDSDMILILEMSIREFETTLSNILASLVAQMVKHLPAIWETQVRSLGWEDLLEKRMATHSSILAWRIPWTEEPGGLQSMGLQRVGQG